MSLNTDNQPVEGQAPSAPLPKPAPSIWWAILFGIWGALFIEIRKSFGRQTWPTKRYWKFGAIATVISMVPFVLLIVALVALGAAVGSPNSVAQTNSGLTATSSQPTASVPAPTEPVASGGIKLPPKPALTDYKANAQWFEDVIILGINSRDTRYFDAAFVSRNVAAYTDTVKAMGSSEAGAGLLKADISNFSVQASGPAYFIATYDVAYEISAASAPSPVNHEKIQAVLLNDGAQLVWKLDISTFSN